MSSDLSAPRPVSSPRTGALIPLRGAGGASASSAPAGAAAVPSVTRVGGGETHGLRRSGVAGGDLAHRADAVLLRTPVADTEARVGLEAARAALVRRDPVQVLTALDAVWTTAATHESGWYLRAGALTALGLAGEGTAVALRGLERTPRSRALRLVLALARAAGGDVRGARELLQQALEAEGEEPVLLATLAVLHARQGREREASEAARPLRSRWRAHPATAWMEEALRSARADVQRAGSRAVELGEADVAQACDAPTASTTSAEDAASATSDDADGSDAARASLAVDVDATREAFAALGRHVERGERDAARQQARRVLRALSADGAWRSSWPASQAHAARSVLASVLEVLHAPSSSELSHALDGATADEPTASEARATMRALLLTLAEPPSPSRASRERTPPPSMRTLCARLPHGWLVWMCALLRDTRHFESVASTVLRVRDGLRSTPPRAGDSVSAVQVSAPADDDSVLTPLRLGLALLPEPRVHTSLRRSGAHDGVAAGDRDGALHVGETGAWRTANDAYADTPGGAMGGDPAETTIGAPETSSALARAGTIGAGAAVSTVAWMLAGPWVAAAVLAVGVATAVLLVAAPRRAPDQVD
ncbi:MAG: hypothetical protein LCH84_17925 [Gemmatimonadetes bacterium]|nr:hypothetical protein [Gemmatimonadota bacterium]